MRSFQLLVSTMNQSDLSIAERMNIHSDALIINQTDHIGDEKKEIGGREIRMLSFAEKGVGLSRNSAMMRSDADIIEFADDDMVFEDDHRDLVLTEFSRHPEADAILFSIRSMNPHRPLLTIQRFGRVRRRKALKYGCARLAVRREKVVYNNLSFSLLFGGGCTYGSGEDTVFLQRMLDAGLHIYQSPIMVARVQQDGSSWFEGYTEKYFFDKGALFAAALPNLCYPYALLTALRFGNKTDRRMAYRKMTEGIEEFRRRSRHI